MIELNTKVIKTEKAYKKMMRRLKTTKILSLDTETVSKDNLELTVLGLGLRGKEYILAPKYLSIDKIEGTLSLIAKNNTLVLMHNAKFDWRVCNKYGVDIKNIHDTIVMAYLIDELQKLGLFELAKKYLDYDLTEWSDKLTLEQLIDHNAKDVRATRDIYDLFKPMLKEQKLEVAFELDTKLPRVLTKMERYGVPIDVPYYKELRKKMLIWMAKKQKEIYKDAGMKFNMNSPKQVGVLLVNKFDSPIYKRSRRTGEPSWDKNVLMKVAETIPFAGQIVGYRAVSKLLSTYVEGMMKKMDARHRLHTDWRQVKVTTGRFASGNPNLQNIPRDDKMWHIRNGFIAPKGWRLICADYSQIELRLFAHYSQDKNMLKAYQKGLDIHQQTADALGITRQHAKNINFGLIYGMHWNKLAADLKCSIPKAKAWHQKWFTFYDGARPYQKQVVNFCRAKGYVRTLAGRKRRIEAIVSPDKWQRGHAERQSINSKIQGTAGDLIKASMIKIDELLDVKECRMTLTVHDELVFMCKKRFVKKYKKIIRRVMENPINKKLSVPITVSIGVGKNWAEAKS